MELAGTAVGGEFQCNIGGATFVEMPKGLD